MSKGNTDLGIHPGSGSLRTVIRNCTASGNGNNGIFICWRVKDALIEGCEISDNQYYGISTGHRDTDNTIINNRIFNNKCGGIHFRPEDEVHAAHRTRIENNEIIDNGSNDCGFGIRVAGKVRDVSIKGNRIGNSGVSDGSNGIIVDNCREGVLIEDNTFINVGREVHTVTE